MNLLSDSAFFSFMVCYSSALLGSITLLGQRLIMDCSDCSLWYSLILKHSYVYVH